MDGEWLIRCRNLDDITFAARGPIGCGSLAWRRETQEWGWGFFREAALAMACIPREATCD
jgi:hypothetical protein